jgi:acyl-CoA synthetase (AMP-forming)/AMP-acid ligase II
VLVALFEADDGRLRVYELGPQARVGEEPAAPPSSPTSHARSSTAGSVGVAVPATEVQIVDPATGTALGEDEDGEVWIRGPQVMAGYLDNEEATKATIDGDGWLHTGDIGHVDSDGHLYVVDRLKELIKFKGVHVAPAELEALLLTHPKVADAAVIGLPDDEAGELPAAYLVLKPQVKATAEEIESFVAGRVATYKQVRKVTFVDAIPKSASGKILRRVLRDEAGVGPSSRRTAARRSLELLGAVQESEF